MPSNEVSIKPQVKLLAGEQISQPSNQFAGPLRKDDPSAVSNLDRHLVPLGRAEAICVLGKAGPGVCAEACACQVPLAPRSTRKGLKVCFFNRGVRTYSAGPVVPFSFFG